MSLARLINPSSIAVVGASERPSIGRSVVENLQLMEFAGTISPVNPKYEQVLGLDCVPTLRDLPQPPDVAVFCLGSSRVLEHYRLLPEIGAGGAVIFDGGFAEAGPEGRELQSEITTISRDADIALCGPNCMGLLNPARGSGSYAQLIHDPAQLVGNVGVISHSGSICIGLMSDTRRFGFSVIVSSGNEAVVTTADYIDYLVDDPATTVIAAFMETVRDPESFVAALDRAAAAGKPVVVLKVGRTERAQRAITSHTGGLAGESRVLSQVLRAHGAIEVDALDEMTEVLAVCQGTHWPAGHRASVITASGGMAELLLDAAPSAGIDLPPLSPDDKVEMEAVIGPVTGDGNPLDAWGSGQFMTNLPHALSVARESDAADVIVFVNDAFDGQPMGGTDGVLGFTELLAGSAANSDRPHYQLNTRPGLMHRDQVAALADVGCATIGGVRQGLQAISRVATFSQRTSPPALQEMPSAGRVGALLSAGPRPTIHEHDAKAVVAEYGIPTTRERLVTDRSELVAAAEEIGFPVALKVISDEIAHKSDHGLVITGIAGPNELDDARDALETRLAKLDGVTHAGLLVQEMIVGGVEVFAGVSRDADFGPVLAFGLGGVAVELLDDVALRVLPLRAGDAAGMVHELRAAPLLQGFRGGPAADVTSLVNCLENLGRLAWAERDHIAEIDLNPIRVLPQGEGCVAVDALIVPRANQQGAADG